MNKEKIRFYTGQYFKETDSVYDTNSRCTCITGSIWSRGSACGRKIWFNGRLISGIHGKPDLKSCHICNHTACNGNHCVDRKIYRRKEYRSDRAITRRSGYGICNCFCSAVCGDGVLCKTTRSFDAGTAGGDFPHDRLCENLWRWYLFLLLLTMYWLRYSEDWVTADPRLFSWQLHVL